MCVCVCASWKGWEANKEIISQVCCSVSCETLTIPPQTWWLWDLFLVSLDKHPCLHRDIPLTQPLVIVYTTFRQTATLCQVSTPIFILHLKYGIRSDWIIRAFFLSPPIYPPPTLATKTHMHKLQRHTHTLLLSLESKTSPTNIDLCFLGYSGPEKGGHNFWIWTILIRPSHPLLWVCL